MRAEPSPSLLPRPALAAVRAASTADAFAHQRRPLATDPPEAAEPAGGLALRSVVSGTSSPNTTHTFGGMEFSDGVFTKYVLPDVKRVGMASFTMHLDHNVSVRLITRPAGVATRFTYLP